MEHTDGCSAHSTHPGSKLQIRPISPIRHQKKTHIINLISDSSLILYVYHEINRSKKKNLKEYANNVNLSDCIENFKADNVTI